MLRIGLDDIIQKAYEINEKKIESLILTKTKSC